MRTDAMIPPTRLHGRYALLRVLGHGAFSVVYEAEDTLQHGVHVAIKCYHDEQRFPIEEVQTLACLAHRGIPRLHEVFFAEQHWHLVMDLVEGETLEQHRRSSTGLLPVQEVREIGLQLSSMLDELHKKDILYRDLKPANVMRTWQGQIMLVDFGGASHTLDNDFYVTPPYAAPEQRVGLVQIDHRADIYALGVILHELLTGDTTFAVEPCENMRAEALRSVSLRMVAQNPVKRIQSMSEVILQVLSV